jgi:hypothetical protein
MLTESLFCRAAIRSNSPVSYARRVTLAVQEYMEQAAVALEISLKRNGSTPTSGTVDPLAWMRVGPKQSSADLLSPLMWGPLINETFHAWLRATSNTVSFNSTAYSPLRASTVTSVQ